MLYPFKLGLLLGLSLIVSIGAQNLFVIKQGIRRDSPFLCALTCFLCDVVLILLGATGVNAFLILFPKLKIIILILGLLFLLRYGASAIRSAFNIKGINAELLRLKTQTSSERSTLKLIFLALSFSLLNPQAILDTLVIIGGNASHYLFTAKYLFVLGTIAASFIWFMGLALATSYFSRQLMNAKFWCGLEVVSGLVMLSFAANFLIEILT